MGAEDVEAGVEEGCMVDGGDEAAEVITTPSQINILHHHHSRPAHDHDAGPC